MKIKIISSQNHWRNGCLTTPKEVVRVTKILQKATIDVSHIEVNSIGQLNSTLRQLGSDTLIWANAYYVSDGKEAAWLNDFLDAYDLPYIGSSADTLKHLLQKDKCQAILKDATIPIPSYLVIDKNNLGKLDYLLQKKGLDFPLVLKPTAESGSVGITMAHHSEATVTAAKDILNRFPLSKVIIEEFLPSDDITCGFLKLGQQIMLLPTYYLVKSKPGKTHILSRKERLRDWDDVDKIQPYITNDGILAQLNEHIPNMVNALNINDITRIDGRLDKNGTLRFFDVNGLPALDFPDSVMNNQCFTCFPTYSQAEVFEALIYTIVHNAMLRYGFDIPSLLQDHNLFTLTSDIVITSQLRVQGRY